MLVSLAIFFVCVVIHEFSHALAATRLGDTTAKRMGRLTLNPLAHIDPVGTVLLPLMLVLVNAPVIFGWAKPVPINFWKLRNPKKDIVWVGLSGPLSNLATALLAAFILKIVAGASPAAAAILRSFIAASVILAVFNLVPIPPLDGSRILFGLLPPKGAAAYAKLDPYGFLVLFALLYVGFFERFVWPVAYFIIYLLGRIAVF